MKKASVLTVWRDFLKFRNSPEEWRRLVFYSEGPEYWLHFKPLVEEILSRDAADVSYVSSSPDDPGLRLVSPRLHPFCIGFGMARTLWFMTLRAKVLAMTMPDLDTFHIKRSSHPVYYAYLFHAPVSTHMMYREAAFDHFDEIFCVGPYHEREIRRREELAGLPAKTLFRHGCSRLDDLIAKTSGGGAAEPNNPPWVMIASSWTDNGIIATVCGELARMLLDAGFRVTVRSHPRTRLIHPERLDALRREFGGNPLFSLEDGSAESAALAKSDLMICDWSGVAVEYAFVRGKPVLSIETPRKVNNPNYQSLGLEPMEAAVRSAIGETLPPGSLSRVPEIARRLCAGTPRDDEARRNLRNEWIFNTGKSDRIAADRLLQLAARSSAKQEGHTHGQ